MKFKCKRDQIQNKIARAVRLTGKNTTLPVLGGLLLVLKGKELRVRATNLDAGVELFVPVVGGEDGEVVVPGALLSQLVSSVGGPDTELKFELIGNNLTVSAGKHSSLVKTLPAEDFPSLPRAVADKKYSIKVGRLVSLVGSVLFSAATSEIKPEIASVLLRGDGKSITGAATDSFRLAEKKVPIEGGRFDNVLIPHKNTAELIRFFDDVVDLDAEFWFDENQITVSCEDRYFTSRLVDGVYPDYKQIIPAKFSTEAVVLKGELSSALRISGTFLDSFNRISITVMAGDSYMEIETHNSDVGENVTRLDAHTSGEDVSMGFNHRYVADVFQALRTDSVAFRFNGPDRPMTISGVGDDSFLYLVMPVTR